MKLTLPSSKWTVEIKEMISYEEYESIQNFFTDRMKVEVDVDPLNKQHKTKSSVDGSLIGQSQQRMIEVFLLSCRGDGNAEISNVGLMKRLDMEDGIFLKNKIADTFKAIKKKLNLKD